MSPPSDAARKQRKRKLPIPYRIFANLRRQAIRLEKLRKGIDENQRKLDELKAYHKYFLMPFVDDYYKSLLIDAASRLLFWGREALLNGYETPDNIVWLDNTFLRLTNQGVGGAERETLRLFRDRNLSDGRQLLVAEGEDAHAIVDAANSSRVVHRDLQAPIGPIQQDVLTRLANEVSSPPSSAITSRLLKGNIMIVHRKHERH